MLHCGNEFRMEVCSFRFGFDDIVPRNGKIISSSFSGAIETEQNNNFSFLDINITRENNQLKTSFYRKPTFSGVFTQYESYIDQSYKKSLIFILLFRCYSLCSGYTLFHLEVEKLREIFKKNSYPSSIIELSIRTFLNRLYVPKLVYSTAPKKELLIILPFLGTM